MSLVTPTEVGVFLPGIVHQDNAHVEQLIELADTLLASWLAWPSPDGAFAPTLELSTYTEYLPAWSSTPRCLVLGCLVVVSVTSVHTDATGDFAGQESEVVAASRQLRGSVVRQNSTSTVAFLQDEPSNRVVYTGGFDATEDEDGVVSTPPHIRAAMLLCIRELWTLKSVPGLPNALDSVPTDAVITAEIKTLISRHRRVGGSLG